MPKFQLSTKAVEKKIPTKSIGFVLKHQDTHKKTILSNNFYEFEKSISLLVSMNGRNVQDVGGRGIFLLSGTPCIASRISIYLRNLRPLPFCRPAWLRRWCCRRRTGARTRPGCSAYYKQSGIFKCYRFFAVFLPLFQRGKIGIIECRRFFYVLNRFNMLNN